MSESIMVAIYLFSDRRERILTCYKGKYAHKHDYRHEMEICTAVRFIGSLSLGRTKDDDSEAKTWTKANGGVGSVAIFRKIILSI